jgi:hypothetical protein
MKIACNRSLVLHDKEAIAFENNDNEVAAEFRRKCRIIAGGFQYLLRGADLPDVSDGLLFYFFVSHKLLRWHSGIVFLSLIVSTVVLMATGMPVHLSFKILGCLVASGILIATLSQLFPVLRKSRLLNAIHYFFLLQLACLKGFYLQATGKQSVRWRAAQKCAASQVL